MLRLQQQILTIPKVKMIQTQKEVSLTHNNLTTQQKEFIEGVFQMMPHVREESLSAFFKIKAGIYNQPLPCLAMFPAKGRVIFYQSKNGQITDTENPIAVIRY